MKLTDSIVNTLQIPPGKSEPAPKAMSPDPGVPTA